MNIDKAIELLSLKPITGDKALDHDMEDAMRLGAEALKLIAWIRQGHIPASDFRLPGETQE